MASIARRPDGRWRARYRDDADREHAKHFTRKVDAQRWLDEVTTAVVSGTYVDPAAGQVTLAAFYETWATRQTWASGTTAAMNLAMRDCTFADVPLARLRRSHVEAWIKGMTDRGLAPGTVRTRVGNVRSVLRGAVVDRHLAVDPSVGVRLPRLRRREAAMRLPTTGEVASILAASDAATKVLASLAAFAGLRLGEACGLQVGDIDFLRRTIRVQRQVQRAEGGAVEITPPKYGSEREVFVPAALLDALAAYIAEHRQGTDASRWLLAGSDGAPLHQNSAGHRWRTACRAAGVAGIRLHDLRHFYASGLIAAGCDVVTVQRALGHRSATVTLGTYSHLWPSAEDRTRAAAGGLAAAVANAAADSLRTSQG
ncbi:tyrosine-type recombinase/integrase [Quadrisphaera setariae]|uniref:Site-specific integrase n=1 Tax=Quadrisphaera setariae TaxID=2593304 RepID=A0A5C8ZG13_9ACTN|nr:site-specific integrase [Quadrisphaera setariae]TXR56464.1 site-specific integrase [Quadrisphaera setariae]